jgi:MFS transporter, SP family, general alpha glucoside:H+ symporter
MMERTVEVELAQGGTPSLLELFRRTDLRCTTIICLMYASQNFAGNLIANEATVFFERKFKRIHDQSPIERLTVGLEAGIPTRRSFQLSLIN